jgi:anti-sigma factor RsiW
MPNDCPWIERVVNDAEPSDAEVARHLESCPTCAVERLTHDELLSAFEGLARPALTPHFRPHLMAKLETERRRKRIARRHLAVLRVYWLMASVICSAVLANLFWSSPASMQQAPVLFGIAVFVIPISVLLIAIRTNPFELILQTLTGTAENSLTEM